MSSSEETVSLSWEEAALHSSAENEAVSNSDRVVLRFETRPFEEKEVWSPSEEVALSSALSPLEALNS